MPTPAEAVAQARQAQQDLQTQIGAINDRRGNPDQTQSALTAAQRAREQLDAANAPLQDQIDRYNRGTLRLSPDEFNRLSTEAGIVAQARQDLAQAVSGVNDALGASQPPPRGATGATGGSPPPAGQTGAPGPRPPQGPLSDIAAWAQRELSQLRTAGVNFSNVQDNILNSYDRYTYHFRLLMVNDRDLEKPDIDQVLSTDAIRKIIIAESGVTTGFNIVDVEITDSVGSNFRTRNTVSTEFKITITEPYGMTLVDRIFLGSRDLGLFNWRMAPLILELTFKFYDRNGNIVDQPAAEKYYRSYKITLTDMNSSLTEVGSTYKITGVLSNSLGFNNFHFIIPQSYTITVGGQGAQGAPNIPSLPQAQGPRPAANTVWAFFQQLALEMTEFYTARRYGYQGGQANPQLAYTPLIVYKFEISPLLADCEIDWDVYTNARRQGLSRQGPGQQEISIGRGTNISSLLDNIVSSIKEADKFFYHDPSTGTVRLPKIECNIKHIGFDDLLNDYIREVTYVVSIQVSNRPVGDPFMGSQVQGSATLSNQRVLNTFEKSLKRIYAYYYTGMNTEIIRLDLDFNNVHMISLPQGGTTTPVLGSADRDRIGREAISRAQEELSRAEERSREFDRRVAQGIPYPGGRQGIEAAQLRLRLSVLEAQTAVQRAQQDLTLLQIQPRADSLRFFDPDAAADLSGRVGLNLPQIAPRIQVDQATSGYLDQVRAANELQRRNPARQFAEDIRLGEPMQFIPLPVADQSQQQQLSALRNNPNQYVYVADPRDIAQYVQNPVQAPIGPEGAQRSRALYTTITEQIYDKQFNHLVEIEMEIRGDPYWLGPSNFERTRELLAYTDPNSTVPSNPHWGASQDRLNDITKVNYHDYDASFMLIFRPGQIPDPNTGFMDWGKQSPYFNGLYLALEITNIFAQGKFTQKIRAQRDNMVLINNLAPSQPDSQPQPAQSLPG